MQVFAASCLHLSFGATRPINDEGWGLQNYFEFEENLEIIAENHDKPKTNIEGYLTTEDELFDILAQKVAVQLGAL